MFPLLAPSQTRQTGQDLDWATGLSPLGTEPEAVQTLRCLMMSQVMSCAVQLALSVQQPGSHSELSGAAQQGQPQTLGAVTVMLALAPTTDYQVQQHLEAAARAAELEEGGRERSSTAQLEAWPPGSLRDQVQAQLLSSQAWPAGWVSVVDALALLTLLALPSSPRQSLSLKTTLVLLVYGVVREPHSLQELDQVLDQQARMRLQEAHVQELSKSGTWEEEVELLRGTVLMTTAQQLLTGDDIASLDEYKVLASQLTGRCSRYLPASHFFQV
ncbi:hypothetical protein HaLaN_11013 [Haematococcus lacustris]|uniref:Uncharacterized protein n=1 Tax=Haematococcus lacustris TaxID=44745 RepID=A0A699YYY7_HAELA|nr:hypothetical protein HaLaN_11013 [Haematococcus lacustris]